MSILILLNLSIEKVVLRVIIGMAYYHWTKDEENYLIANYYSEDKLKLISNLKGRCWGAIVRRAKLLGVNRKIDKRNSLSNLLQETPEAYYWIGFLMADGHFSDRRISLAIAVSDIEHLKKYQSFIGSTNKISFVYENYARIHSTGVREVSTLKEKFKITSNKTYKPCDIQSIKDKELLFSLIVGFIDGDGSIVKNKQCDAFCISVVGHPAWNQNQQYMQDFLFAYFNETDNTIGARVSSRETSLPQSPEEKKRYESSTFYIYKKSLIKKMKARAQELSLPIMSRKWDKIS